MNKDWPHEFSLLARYNSETASGLIHSAAWKKYMAEIQRHFDRWAEEDLRRRKRRGLLRSIFRPR